LGASPRWACWNPHDRRCVGSM